MLLRLFIAALWSPTGMGLASWLLHVVFNCVFVTFPCGILGLVWSLIISIADLCPLSYLVHFFFQNCQILLSLQCVKAILFLDILKNRLNVNAQNDMGNTPLHLASKWGYGKIGFLHAFIDDVIFLL